MAALVSDTEMRLAKWLVGEYGDAHGVCVTKSNVLVKFGSHVQGQRETMAIELVRRSCPSVPVPEVYGTWKSPWVDGVETGYIAMSYMPGTILKDVWPSLTPEGQQGVLQQLQEIIRQLRCISVPPDAKIGAVDGLGKAADSRGGSTAFGGPFRGEDEFNDWLLSQIHPTTLAYHSTFFESTLRTCLQSNAAQHSLRFTHEDLGMHNILFDGQRITAIIDWEYAGWYPEYWEYVKMIQFTRDPTFRCWARQCWEDINGSCVSYDAEFATDQLLDSQIRNGERVIKRPW